MKANLAAVRHALLRLKDVTLRCLRGPLGCLN